MKEKREEGGGEGERAVTVLALQSTIHEAMRTTHK
jgi:hypothetical protein